jgi:hypothetical protein
VSQLHSAPGTTLMSRSFFELPEAPDNLGLAVGSFLTVGSISARLLLLASCISMPDDLATGRASCVGECPAVGES